MLDVASSEPIAAAEATTAETAAAAAGETPEPAAPAPEPSTQTETPLRPLTALRWPPEPDASIFMDPLKRDDPKPLRHAELERIGESVAAVAAGRGGMGQRGRRRCMWPLAESLSCRGVQLAAHVHLIPHSCVFS
jgi:hypothetical protein